MNLKKRLLGGAILTALAGTTAYFCSNNDESSKPYESASIEKRDKLSQPEQNFPIIFPNSYPGEKNSETEISKEEVTKKESLDEKVKRLSDLFEERYKQCVTIQRDYSSDEHTGKIITSEGGEWRYGLNSSELAIEFAKNTSIEFKFNFHKPEISIDKLVISGRTEKDYLTIIKGDPFPIAYTLKSLAESMKDFKEIKNDKEIYGFRLWNNIVTDILLRHPECIK